MRKAVLIVGSLVGVLLIVIVALLGYAVLNLNSIIAAKRDFILAKAGDALGRRVEAKEIKASLGWGVSMDVAGVSVADDPTFSTRPFVQASDVYVNVEFVPLLYRQLNVTSLVLDKPQVEIIRNPNGELNVNTLGKKPRPSAANVPPPPRPPAPAVKGRVQTSPLTAESKPGQRKEAGAAAALGSLSARRISIQDGTVVYKDPGLSPKPLTISSVNLTVDNFSFDRSFNVALSLAALAKQPNLTLSGQAGPLMHNGAIDVPGLPFDLVITLGPLTLDQVRQMPGAAALLPKEFSLTGGVGAKAKVDGTLSALKFGGSSDLTANQLAYANLFNKPAGVRLSLSVDGSRSGNQLQITRALFKLAGLELTAGDIAVASGSVSARVDTNRCDLASLGKLVAAMNKYQASGAAEAHLKVKAASGAMPDVNGTVSLAGVTVKPATGAAPPVGNLTGDVRIAGQSADIGPLTFNLGSGRAQLSAKARSFKPVNASYALKADTIKVAELVPSRKSDVPEHLDQVNVTGTLKGTTAEPDVTTNATSTSGSVNNIDYRNLLLAAEYAGNQLKIGQLKVDAFSGALAAAGTAQLGSVPSFNVAANLANINVQQVLASQKSKAAGQVQGLLTGNIQVAGRGSNFDEIKPTLAGNGRASVKDGKLIGINVAAEAMKKVQGIPGIDTLVPPQIVERHPELFQDHDTELEAAGLTFQIGGPRITTHDLTVQSTDYTVLGDGWFDLDRKVDMGTRLLLSRSFSSELQSYRKNVVYLVNRDGQVEIPVRVIGELPKPKVVPDVQELAQRAASHVVEQQGRKFLGGALKRTPLGGLLEGGSSSGGSPSGGSPGAGSSGGGSSGGSNQPPNPLNTLKGLFR